MTPCELSCLGSLVLRVQALTSVVCACSGVDEMAPEYPVQRARMVSAAASCSDAAGCPAARFTHAGQAMGRLPGEPELPIVGGGCDDDEPTPPAPWDDETHAQHPGIVIFPRGLPPPPTRTSPVLPPLDSHPAARSPQRPPTTFLRLAR